MRELEPYLIRMGAIGAALIAWQALHTYVWPLFLPSVPAVFDSLVAYVIGPNFLTDLAGFLAAMSFGFATALSTGIVIGLFMGVNRVVSDTLNPLVTFLYVTPMSAIVPLLILWLGFDVTTHVTVVYLFSVFPIVVNTHQGVKSAPLSLVEMGRTFGANPRWIFTQVVLPHAIPFVIAGARLGVVRSITGLVLAQLLITPFGFGERIMDFTSRFQLAPAFSVLVVLMGLSVILSWCVRLFEAKATPWRRLERGITRD